MATTYQYTHSNAQDASRHIEALVGCGYRVTKRTAKAVSLKALDHSTGATYTVYIIVK